MPLVALCFWIGIYPKPVLDFLHGPMARLAAPSSPAASTRPRRPAHGRPDGARRGARRGAAPAPPPATLLTEPAVVPAGH